MTTFPTPIRSWDFHFYFALDSKEQIERGHALHSTVLREFSGKEDYESIPAQTDIHGPFGVFRHHGIHDKPLGPHPCGMFEFDSADPVFFGRLTAWLTQNRDGHSVLIHPRLFNDEKDWKLGLEEHTTQAIWIGDKIPLKLEIFDMMRKKFEAEAQSEQK